MKSILISIRPKWVEKIASGKKTIEVRKTAPKEIPFKAYIYETKKEHLRVVFKKGDFIFSDDHSAGKFDENIFVKDRYSWQGKVIGEFICDKVYSIKNQGSRFSVADEEQSVTNEIARQSCLDYDDMVSYLGDKDGYGLHIINLKIYDKPKELSEFCIPCKVSCENCKNPLYFECLCEEKGKKIVTRPPQSWQYVEELCKAQN